MVHTDCKENVRSASSISLRKNTKEIFIKSNSLMKLLIAQKQREIFVKLVFKLYVLEMIDIHLRPQIAWFLFQIIHKHRDLLI